MMFPLIAVFSFIFAETDTLPLSVRITNDIQASIYSRQPSLWGAAERAYEIRIEWSPQELTGELQYRRQVRRSPDGGDLLVESWRFRPDDLPTLLALWGHPDDVSWSEILGPLPNGRLIASKNRGLLLIIREYPQGAQAWRMAPFPLNAVPTLDYPHLAQAVNSVGKQDPDGPHETSKFADFFADLFVEELLDREGVSVRISKHWDIEGRFSRLSPVVRIERRIRLDFGGTYSVFDLFTLGGEVLLGSRRQDDEIGDYAEAGAFLDVEKKVVVIRKGYQKWYGALFADPFPITKIPYSRENLEALPLGVRFVFPSTAGVTLIGRRTKPTQLSGDIPLEMQVFAGLNGTFFISLAKISPDELNFYVGGRIERLGEAHFKMRPDFDGPFDPLRLLMGTLTQIRGNRTRGTSLFLQKNIDLRNPGEIESYRQCVRRGVRLTGFPLGVAAVLNLAFRREWDERFVEQALHDNLPEISWERTYLSHYSLFENYAKLGLRPIGIRTHTFGIDDDWVVDVKAKAAERCGRSISLTTRRNLRLPGILRQRTIQANGIVEKEGQGGALQGKFLEIVDLTDRSRMSYESYRKIVDRMQTCFTGVAGMSDLATWPPNIRYHDVQLGYRIIFSKDALEKLAHRLVELRRTDRRHPLARWLRFHPILRRRLVRIDENPEAGFVALAKLLFKLVRKKGPVYCLFEDLNPRDFTLQWRGVSAGNPRISGQIGEAIIPIDLVHLLRQWESMGVLDDLYVERNFNARFE